MMVSTAPGSTRIPKTECSNSDEGLVEGISKTGAIVKMLLLLLWRISLFSRSTVKVASVVPSILSSRHFPVLGSHVTVRNSPHLTVSAAEGLIASKKQETAAAFADTQAILSLPFAAQSTPAAGSLCLAYIRTHARAPHRRLGFSRPP